MAGEAAARATADAGCDTIVNSAPDAPTAIPAAPGAFRVV